MGNTDAPAAEEDHVDDVEGWRMALLLLMFATITVILEFILKRLERSVRHRKGLSTALHHIKDELLYVGTISLLLSAFQNELAKICIPDNSGGVYARLRRSLLGAVDVDVCGPGKVSLWPVSLQHDTHIFIFVVACTHIVYGTVTIYLTLLRVNRWLKWELEAHEQHRQGDVKVKQLPARWLYENVGSNPLFHCTIMLFKQFDFTITPIMYHNCRLLFIEKMGLPYDFDFHKLVVLSLEEELAHTLRPEWHLWLIAVVWFVIPPPAYVSFWMFGISVCLILVIGGKLYDILGKIAVQVAVKYGDSVLYGRMEADPMAQLARTHIPLGRSSLRARNVLSNTIRRRFLESEGIFRPGGAHDSNAGGSGGIDGDGGDGGAGSLALAFSAHSKLLLQLSDRRQVMKLLRSWATSGGDVARSSGGVGGVAGGDGGGDAAPLPPAASGSADARNGGSGEVPAAAAAAELQLSSGARRLPAAATMPHRHHHGLGGAGSGGGGGVSAAQVQVQLQQQPMQQVHHTRDLARGSAPALSAYRMATLLRRAREGDEDGGVGGGRPYMPSPSFHVGAPPPPPRAAPVPAEASRGSDDEGSGAHAQHALGMGGVTHVVGRFGRLFSRQRGGEEADIGRPSSRVLSVIREGNAGEEPTQHGNHHKHEQREQQQQQQQQGAHGGQEQGQHQGGHTSAFEAMQRVARHEVEVLRDAFHLTHHRSHDEHHSHEQEQQGQEHVEQPEQGQQLAAAAADGDAAAHVAPAPAPAPAGASLAHTNGDAHAADGSAAGGGSEVHANGGVASGKPSVDAMRASPSAAVTAAAAATAARASEGGGDASSSCSNAEEEEDAGHDEAGWRRSRSGRGSGGAGSRRVAPAGGAGPLGHSVSGVRVKGTKRVPLLLRPCYCGAQTMHTSTEYVQELLRKRKKGGMAQTDAADFFWFRKPRSIPFLFTLVYFQNSLSIAICIFAFSGGYSGEGTWEGVPFWAALLQLFLDLLLVPQISLGVLPTYALITPLGSHCPKSVLKSAVKAGLYPRQTRMVAKALQLKLEAAKHMTWKDLSPANWAWHGKSTPPQQAGAHAGGGGGGGHDRLASPLGSGGGGSGVLSRMSASLRLSLGRGSGGPARQGSALGPPPRGSGGSGSGGVGGGRGPTASPKPGGGGGVAAGSGDSSVSRHGGGTSPGGGAASPTAAAGTPDRGRQRPSLALQLREPSSPNANQASGAEESSPSLSGGRTLSALERSGSSSVHGGGGSRAVRTILRGMYRSIATGGPNSRGGSRLQTPGAATPGAAVGAGPRRRTGTGAYSHSSSTATDLDPYVTAPTSTIDEGAEQRV